MAHLLVSWIAYRHDFIYTAGQKAASGINETGPTVQFHQHFYAGGGYDKHVLLYANPQQELQTEHLANLLRRQHPERAVQAELLEVRDIISLAEITSKIETWLLQHREHELTLYFSPGTSIMQLSWFIAHTTLGLNTHLVQTREGKFNPDGCPSMMELDVTQSAVPMTAIVREQQVAARTAASAPALRAARRSQATAEAPPATPGKFLLLPGLQRVYNLADKVAGADKLTVLVRGESGTGKEHLARTVHDKSVRCRQPYLPLNCAAFTDSVLESRLFGYVKGAFTGADKDTKGLFELAHGGTIFLDEIGDISPALQATLLRVVQTGEIQPLGGQPRHVDVRVVAATHADLLERCQQGIFRWDLYYRLAVAELELPALRELPQGEREQLLDFFIHQKQTSLRRTVPLELAPATRQQLLNYPFPGNVRELENLVETLYVFSEPGQLVLPADLPRRLHIRAVGAGKTTSLTLAAAVAAHVALVVAQCGGVKRQAAQLLGIDVRVVAKHLKQHKEAVA
jgi:transcriptional regulator with GAF, ATPase, and Fis domain